tara:strand:- start:698 stop:1261 length:564 start_codon:yes stop_codon:yes gene_type:complete
MTFAPTPTAPYPWQKGGPRNDHFDPRRDSIFNVFPFTRTEEDKAVERLEQKRQWEEQIRDRLGNIMGGGKPRMAGEAIGVDAAAAAEGNKTGEAIGSTAGGLAAGIGLGMLDGPSPVLDIVGGTIGSQVGGLIGAHIPRLPFAQANQDAMLTNQHQQLIGARDPRSQNRLPFGLESSFLDPKTHVVY